MSDNAEILFEATTPLGFSVHTTAEYGKFIVTIKHPIMHDRLSDVQTTLSDPDKIHLSKTDPQVYLFYREDGTKRWVCTVARRLNGNGFLLQRIEPVQLKKESWYGRSKSVL